MEKRVTCFERRLTSNINDIERIESQSYSGYAVVKICFHPNVKIDVAVAQTTATMQPVAPVLPQPLLVLHWTGGRPFSPDGSEMSFTSHCTWRGMRPHSIHTQCPF